VIEAAVESHTSRHLDGRVVVVTGGARGIGLAIARAAAAEGAKIVIADIGADIRQGRHGSADAASEAAAWIRDLGGSAVAHPADIATADGAQGAVDLAIREFGAVNGIVCCAGTLVQAELDECTKLTQFPKGEQWTSR
jgi:NAD(P)-dependent dehydrogenase (short-subunit alcohol dehydrogenase family)